MLVIVFIIALLSSLVLANYQIGRQGLYLNSGAQRLAGDLRRVSFLMGERIKPRLWKGHFVNKTFVLYL